MARRAFLAVLGSLLLIAGNARPQVEEVIAVDSVLPGVELGSEIVYDYDFGKFVHVRGNKTTLVLVRILNFPDPWQKLQLITSTGVYQSLVEDTRKWDHYWGMFTDGGPPSRTVSIVFPRVVIANEVSLSLQTLDGVVWNLDLPPPDASGGLPVAPPTSCNGIKSGTCDLARLEGTQYDCGEKGRNLQINSDVYWTFSSPPPKPGTRTYPQPPHTLEMGFDAPAAYTLHSARRVMDHIEIWDGQGMPMGRLEDPFEFSWETNGWMATQSNFADYRLVIAGMTTEELVGWSCRAVGLPGWLEGSFSIANFELGIMRKGEQFASNRALLIWADQGFVSTDPYGDASWLANLLIDRHCGKLGIDPPDWAGDCSDYLYWIWYNWGEGKEKIQDSTRDSYILKAAVSENGPHTLAVNFYEEIRQINGCGTPGSLTVYAKMDQRLHLAYYAWYQNTWTDNGDTRTVTWPSQNTGTVRIATGTPSDGCTI